MKVLVIKSDLAAGAAAQPLDAKLLWLDELCHGLLSQARFKGFFSREVENNDLWVVRPSQAPLDYALIWTKKSAFPWHECEKIAPDLEQLFYAGAFSESELKEAKKKWKAQPWEAPSGQE